MESNCEKIKGFEKSPHLSEQWIKTVALDMVFCVDCSLSMKKHLENVKKTIIRMVKDIKEHAETIHSKATISARARLIVFRDFLSDGENAMLVTDFFDFPEQEENFLSCLNSLEAKGGNERKDGLEALGYAIRSKWDCEKRKKRQIIVLFTDSGCNRLGEGKSSPYYPKGMAEDIFELTAWWGSGQQKGFVSNSSKALTLFAPDAADWSVLSRHWDSVIHFPSEAGEGLKDFEYEQIIRILAHDDI